MNNHPIGIFDSGLGGLSIAKAIHQLMPNEHLYYIADSLNAPYGNKSQAFIQQRSIALVQQLIEQKSKAIVVACNTATVSSIGVLRKQFDIPIIGVEPGVKPAIKSTKTGVVGVLATEKTVNSDSFLDLVKYYAHDVNVVLQACPGLVEQVEQLQLEGAEVKALLNQYLTPLLKQKVDTIVLGCTHYPFLQPLIEQMVGPTVLVINTSMAVAKQVAWRMTQEGLKADFSQQGMMYFYSAWPTENMNKKFQYLWKNYS